MGGNVQDIGYGLAFTKDGSVYVTGFTESGNFPTKNAYDPTHNGLGEVFIVKFSDQSKKSSSYAFFSFAVILPILVLVRKRRK